MTNGIEAQPVMTQRSQRLLGFIRFQIALFAGAASVPAYAVSYSGPVANWGMRDGLPSHKIMTALQTRDGYIWVGTWDGLARFDGSSFTRFDAGRTPGLLESSVTALCESPDRAIWIGHGSGAVTRMLNGKLKYYPAPAQRDGSKIQNLACDEAGDVWAFNNTGQLFRVRDDFTLIPETGPAGPVYVMAGSPDGKMAVVSRGKLSILEQGRLRPVEVREGLEPFVRGVCSSSDGGWWVMIEEGLWKWKSGEWTEFSHSLPTGSYLLFTMKELRDGRVAGATHDAGAWIIRPTAPGPEQRFARTTGFPSDWITAMFEDHEGGVWLATGTDGLCRVAEKKVTMLAPAEGLEGRPVLSVTEGPDGTLWIGTEGRGVFRYQDGTWTQFRSSIGLMNHFVWSVATTPDGTLWAGTWGNGIFRFGKGKFHGAENIKKGALIWQVAAMVPSVQGGLLVGSLKGIYRWSEGREQWLEPEPARVATNVRALLEEEGGSVVWAGCWERGLVRIAADGIRQYTQADGLSSNDVNCLHRDRSGALWIGTNGGGLNRLKDGHIDVVRTAHGLSDNSIGHIAEDAAGNFWLSSRAGLMRIAAAQLHACADGKLAQLDIETFGYSDGLTTLNFSASVQPAGWTLRNGRLAFATDRGVAVVDPANLSRNRVPPPVYIEEIVIGDQRVPIGDQRLTYKVPAGFKRLEIKYTALSFAGPEKVMFRRQLQPLEQRPTVVRNERSVVYNYLPPGSYTFRVQAANNDGVWSSDAQSVTLVVLPFFWQTAWFRSLVAVLLIAASGTIAWYISRRRLQRRVELLEQEGAIQRERTRIANDMHDELGAQLTRISMLSESARRHPADVARMSERLGQIYETARDVTKAMDEIVWTVNPRHDTLESLVTYLEKYAVDFLGTAGVACRIDAPFEINGWTPNAEVRHNLFLCLKEALTNVVRHSGATMVVLTIRAECSELSVHIADNGRGLSPASPGHACSSRIGGGNGLANLRARMSRIGGSCDIASPPGTGCVVTLKAPLSTLAQNSPS